MPEIISCPDCGRKLRVPDHLLGKRVKCPGCGTMFTGRARDAGTEDTPKSQSRAAAPREERIEAKPRAGRRSVVPPPEADYEDDRPPRRRRDDEADEDDRPRSRRRRDEDEEGDEDYPRSARGNAYEDDEGAAEGGLLSRQQREGWQKVRKGISLIITAIWVMLSTIPVASLGGLVVGAAGAGVVASAQTGGQALGGVAATGVGLILLAVLLGLIGLAANALNIIGRVFCLGVPSRRGALKGLALASLLLCIGQVFSSYLGNAVGLATGAGFGRTGVSPLGAVGGGAGSLFAVLGLLAAVAGFIVFMFFLRSVAFAVKARAVASAIKTFLIAVAIAIGVSMLLGVVMVALAGAALFSALSSTAVGPSAQGVGAATGTAAGVMMIGLALGCVLLLAGLGMFVWYVVILFQVRGAIDRYLRRA
jgi:hypothetical protein